MEGRHHARARRRRRPRAVAVRALPAPAGSWRGTIEPARFLAADLDARRRDVVERALLDVCQCEEPPSSNRSPYIDETLRLADVPDSLITAGKGWWCAAWAGRVFRECGARVPADYAATAAWKPLLAPKGAAPLPGDAILYGDPQGTPQHIGIVVRAAPYLVTVEGNAAWAGAFTANGEAVITRRVDPTSARILGYIHPEPA